MLRVIHPNRWFFWTIAALIVAGFGTMVLIQKALLEIDEHAAVISSSGPRWIDPDYPGWHSIRPEGFGLSLKYPQGWQVEIDRFDAGTLTLENSKDYSENITITVTDPKNEKLIRQSLQVESEEDMVIDGEKGAWLKGADARDTATANVILVKHAGKLYSLAGDARQFEKIVGSVRFVENNEVVDGLKTYWNKEDGFEIKYPSDWDLPAGSYVNWIKTKDGLRHFRVSIGASRDIVPAGLDPKEALKLEDGREPLDLVTERYLTVNGVAAYRARRELKRGDFLLGGDIYDGVTRTDIEYTYLRAPQLYRVWFEIDDDNPEDLVKIFDQVGATFKFTK